MKPLIKRKYFKENLKIKKVNAANIRKLKQKQKFTPVKKYLDNIRNIKPMWKPALKHSMDSAKHITKKYLQFNTRGQRFNHFIKAEKQKTQPPSIDFPQTKYQSPPIGFKPKFVSTPIDKSIESQNDYNKLCAIVGTAAESSYQLLFKNDEHPLFKIKEKLNRLHLSKVKESTKLSELKKAWPPNKQNQFMQNVRNTNYSEVLDLPNTLKTISSLESNQSQNPNIIIGNQTFCSEFERNISLNIFGIDNNVYSSKNSRKRTLYNYDVQKDISKDFFKKKCLFESHKKVKNRNPHQSNYKMRNNAEKLYKLKRTIYSPISIISETPQRPIIDESESTSFITQMQMTNETFGSFKDFNYAMALSPLNCNYLKKSNPKISQKEQTNKTNPYKISKNRKHEKNVISDITKFQKTKYFIKSNLDSKRSATSREKDSDWRFEELFKRYKFNNNLIQLNNCNQSSKNSLQFYKNSWCTDNATENHSHEFFQPIIQNSSIAKVFPNSPNSTFKNTCFIQKRLDYNKKLDYIKDKRKFLNFHEKCCENTLNSTVPSVRIEKSSSNWLLHKVLEWHLLNLKLLTKESNMDSNIHNI